MSGWDVKALRIGVAVVAAGLAFAAQTAAFAQTRSLMAPQATASVPLVPGTGSPGATIVSPVPLGPPAAIAPQVAQPIPVVPAGRVALAVTARYGRDAAPISGGLIWRV